MWPQLLENIKSAPSRLHTRRSEATAWARERATTVKEDGRERLANLEIRALERADTLLERGTDLPVIGRLVTPAAQAIHGRLEQRSALPIDGYDDLNVKAIARELQALSVPQLHRVREHECESKNRKSVLQNIDRELARRERGDE